MRRILWAAPILAGLCAGAGAADYFMRRTAPGVRVSGESPGFSGDFADQADILPNVWRQSGAITVAGFTGTLVLEVAGTGFQTGPAFRVDGGSWVTSASITAGQSVELRGRLPNATGQTASATLTLGGDQTADWTITTAASFGASCAAYLAAGGSDDGAYSMAAGFTAECDMTGNGGGWTRVLNAPAGCSSISNTFNPTAISEQTTASAVGWNRAYSQVSATEVRLASYVSTMPLAGSFKHNIEDSSPLNVTYLPTSTLRFRAYADYPCPGGGGSNYRGDSALFVLWLLQDSSGAGCADPFYHYGVALANNDYPNTFPATGGICRDSAALLSNGIWVR